MVGQLAGARGLAGNVALELVRLVLDSIEVLGLVLRPAFPLLRRVYFLGRWILRSWRYLTLAATRISLAQTELLGCKEVLSAVEQIAPAADAGQAKAVATTGRLGIISTLIIRRLRFLRHLLVLDCIYSDIFKYFCGI